MKTGEATSPGFYLRGTVIEHWSEPCSFNQVMMDHFSNEHGLIMDGFQSVLGFEDINHLAYTIVNWYLHLKRYGVEK